MRVTQRFPGRLASVMSLLVVVAVVVVGVAAWPAAAHQVGLSRSAWVVDGSAGAGGTFDVELTFARPEVLTLLPALDTDHDGTVGDAELTAGSLALGALLAEVKVTRGADACPLALLKAALVEADGLTIAASGRCPESAQPVTAGAGTPGKGDDLVVDFALAQKLGGSHRHLGHVTSPKGEIDVVAFAASPVFTLTSAPAGLPLGDYLVIGMEHILMGYDHLCFLFGLIVVLVRAGRLRSLLAVVTAFTVAHSITLGLAATGTLSLSPSLVEPVIAASIIWVGVESLIVKEPAGRWRLTFVFGLIHGFGFAGALAEIGLPHDAVVPALALFNIGVELGQLAVVAVAFPLLLLLRRTLSPRGQVVFVRVVCAAIIAAGVYWFVERVWGLLSPG